MTKPYLFIAVVLMLSSLALATGDPPRIFSTPDGIKFVRTPDFRFKDIKDFPAEPRYLHVFGMRMAYIDVGYDVKGTILLLHGEPDWAYLYRSMIPIFVRAGYRVVVPDLIGFGRSDKPIERGTYTYDNHVKWVKELVTQLKLKNMAAFLQDWGGPIGLTIAAEEPFRFDRLVLANTLVPNGTDIPGFDQFRDFVNTSDVFDSGMIIQGATERNLTQEEVDAYNAPFPSELFKAGARQFPFLVATKPTDPGVPRFLEIRRKLKSWMKPVLLQWGLKDFVLGKNFFDDFRQLIPGTNGQPHQLYPEANHFIQEDVGPYLAVSMVEWLEQTGFSSQCPTM